jgi:membrane protease YdiL (CAAX protease family)
MRRLARGPLPPRAPYYVAVLLQQLVLTAVSLGVAAALGLELFPPYRPRPGHLALGLGLLAAAILALAPLWRRQVRRRERFVALVAPRAPAERALWAAVSVAAGVGEEITYRGVLFAILEPLVGVPGAVVLAAAAFGLGHLAQGWRAAPLVFGFALGFHALVLATGTLVIAIAVHAVYDLVAGFSYGRLAERYGYPDDPGAQPNGPPPARTPS